MKERRVGEDAVVALRLERELQEVLVQDRAPGSTARHLAERGAAVEPDRLVTLRSEVAEVAPRSTAEVEERKRRRALDRREQRRIVLADVVVFRPFPERLGAALVVAEGLGGDAPQLVRGQHGFLRRS